jgi:hypothetical protein
MGRPDRFCNAFLGFHCYALVRRISLPKLGDDPASPAASTLELSVTLSWLTANDLGPSSKGHYNTSKGVQQSYEVVTRPGASSSANIPPYIAAHQIELARLIGAIPCNHGPDWAGLVRRDGQARGTRDA